MQPANIIARIAELAADVCVATNAGTYSGLEAMRKVGVGDPAFADRGIYERLDGTQYATGPEKKSAPGYMRRLDHLTAAERRAEIATLRALLPKVKR